MIKPCNLVPPAFCVSVGRLGVEPEAVGVAVAARVEMDPRGLVLSDMGVAYGELPDVGEAAAEEYAPGERCSCELVVVVFEGAMDIVDTCELVRDRSGALPRCVLVLLLDRPDAGDRRSTVSRRRVKSSVLVRPPSTPIGLVARALRFWAPSA